MNGARAALAGVAADVGSRELEHVPQVVHEQEPRLHVVLVNDAVHGEFDPCADRRCHGRDLRTIVPRDVLDRLPCTALTGASSGRQHASAATVPASTAAGTEGAPNESTGLLSFHQRLETTLSNANLARRRRHAARCEGNRIS